MKKWAVALWTVVFALALAVPSAAFAEDTLQLGAGQIQPADLITQADPAEGDDDAAQDDADAQTGEDADKTPSKAQDIGDLLPDSMKSQVLLDLQKEGRLSIPESMSKVTVDATGTKYDGIMLEGKRTALEAGKIAVLGTYDFGEKTVGRICVDGLCDRGYNANVLFFLDEQEEPFASIALDHQQGKVGWTREGLRTQDVLAAGVSGEHTVSIGLDVKKANEPEADKKTQVLLRSFEFAANSLPVLYFDLDESQGTIEAMNNSYDHSLECYGTMRVQTPAGYASEYVEDAQPSAAIDEKTYELEYIRGRGNSTWDSDKKPYKVKLDKKADLFGMGANKHWVLIANRFDNSLMRNKLTYWLGQELGLEFTPQCVFVEVVMNGKYLGSYYLCEQVRVGSSRVDIDDLDDEPTATEEPNVTGGYLLSMEWGDGEDDPRRFDTEKGHHFYLESPEFEDTSEEAQKAQYGYISNYVQKVEDAINANDYTLDGVSYDTYFDAASAIDYYWMQMYTINGDAYSSGSTYLYKKRDADGAVGKLYWGPLWDFDFVAWGDLEYDYQNVEGFDYGSAPWLERLLLNKDFNQQFCNRWPVLKALLAQATCEGGKLDQWYEQLAPSRYYETEQLGVYGEGGWDWYGADTGAWAVDALQKDGIKVDGLQGDELQVDGSQNDEPQVDEPRSYKDEEKQLISWITQRTEWVDANFAQLKFEPCEVVFMVDGKVYDTHQAVQGHELGYLPSVPSKKGYAFSGWFFENSEGEMEFVDESTEAVGSKMLLTAEWVDAGSIVPVRKLCFAASEATTLEYEDFYMPYEVFPADAFDQDITWTSSNDKVAAVDSYGNVEVLNPGTTAITATCSSGVKASYKLTVLPFSKYEEISAPDYFEVANTDFKVPAGEARQIKVTLQPEPCTFKSITWISLDPEIAEVGSAGFVRGVNPGTTKVVGFLDQNVSSLVSCNVTVTKSKIAAKVKTQKYTGKEIKPNPVVKYKGKKLKKGADYKLFYYDNIEVGTAFVRIMLTGAKYAERTISFTIAPAKPVAKKAKLSKKGKLTVTWKKAAKKQRAQTTGYQIRWAKKKNMKGAKIKTIKGAGKTKVVLKKAKKAKFVQVRAYKTVFGQKYYSSWSKKLRVK